MSKTKIFISYSRRDKAFTEQLVNELKSRDYDPWVDWDDIPFSVDWWAEICTAIDGHDVVLNMVSNHSVMSRVCNAEISYAREQNKRIIPVIVDKVDMKHVVGELYDQSWEMDARDNWAYTRKLNWVYAYREGDTLARVVDSVAQAVETDHQHLRMHTRILTRAKEWESNNKGHGFLLIGEELDEAEAWLAGISPQKEPQPLDIHREYIQLSRDVQDEQRERYEQMRRQTRRLQRASLLFTLTAVIVISAILFAFRQQQTRTNDLLLLSTSAVETQAAIGEQSAATQGAILAESTANAELQATLVADIDLRLQQAESLRLAVEAQSQLDNGNENLLALPLALAAQNSIADSAPPVQVQRVLASAAYQPGLVRFYTAAARENAHTSEITASVVTADGALLVSGSLDRTVRVWDVETGDLLHTLEASTRVTSLAAHPDGMTVAAGDSDGAITVWDVVSGEQVQRIDEAHTGRLTALAYSPDGEALASGSSDTNVKIWSADDGTLSHTLGRHANRITALAYNPDGETLISADAQGQLYIWEAGTSFWQRREVRHSLAITDIAFNADGSQAVTTSLDGTFIHWIDFAAEQRRVFSVFNADGNGLTSAAFLTGSRVLIGDQSGQLYEWDLTAEDDRSGVLITYAPPTQPSTINTLAMSADGRSAFTGYANGRLSMWAVEHGAVESRQIVHTFPVQDLAVRVDGVALLRDVNGTFYAWDVAGGAVDTFTESALGLRGSVLLPDGVHALAIHNDQPTLFNLDTREVELPYPALNIQTADTVFSLNGELAISPMNTGSSDLTMGLGESGANRLLWRTTDGEQLLTLNGAATHYAFNADGQQLAMIDNTNTLTLIDTASGATVDRFTLEGDVSALAYGINNLPVVGYADGSLTMLTDGTNEWRTLRGHNGAVQHIVMRPDGAHALTVGTDNVALVWDVASEQVLRRFETRTRGLVRGAFLRNDDIVTVSSDGSALHWRVENADRLAVWAANSRFLPTLSTSDCRTFQIPHPCGS